MFQNYENIEGFLMDVLIEQNKMTTEKILSKLSDRKLLDFVLDNICLKEDTNPKNIKVYIQDYFIGSILNQDKLFKKRKKRRNLLILTELLDIDINSKYKLIDILIDYNSNLLVESNIDENALSIKMDYEEIKSKIDSIESELCTNKNLFFIKHNLYYFNQLIGTYYTYEKVLFSKDGDIITNSKIPNNEKTFDKNNLKEVLKNSNKIYKRALENHISKPKNKQKVKIRA